MKLSSILAISVTCLAIIGCDDREGTLTVHNPVVLKNKKGKSVTIPAGNFKAELEGKSKDEIQLEIELNKKEKIEANFKIPPYSLDQSVINISAGQSGQPVDIAGTRDIDSTTTQPQWSTRGCTYTRYEYRCWTVQYPPVCQTQTICGPNGSGCQTQQICRPGGTRQECGNVAVQYQGREEYEYTTTYTTDTLDIELRRPGNSLKEASFRSVVNSSRQNILYVGHCR
jgi:hypothetical protein